MRFDYIAPNGSPFEETFMPYLPVTLRTKQRQTTVMSLVDSGAMVNVLPHEIGLQLGMNWKDYEPLQGLSGNLASAPAVIAKVQAAIGDYAPVNLVFAWSQLNDIPLILGGTNFFNEFEVNFYRFELAFEVKPKS